MPNVSTIAPPPRIRLGWLRALRRPHEQVWTSVLVLLALSAVLFFYGLGSGELYRTESLRAIIGQEFLRSGNWIVPRLYGEPLFTKPPGMYAAIALCSMPFGAVTEWTARLPSAFAATGVVFLMWWYARRHLGPLGGLVTAIIVPLSPMWLDNATSCDIDMLHLGLTTAAVLFALRAVEATEDSEAAPTRWGFWLLAGLFLAAGVLTKWTTPVFVYLTLVPLLCWRRQLRILYCGPHLVGLGLAVGLALAWVGAAVAQEGWPVFYATVSNEGLQRLSPAHSPYPYPWGETLIHPLKLLLIGLPFSALALLTLRGSFWELWDDRGRRLLQELHCWVWPAMLFMTFPTEHAPRHSLPLYPALSALGALVVVAWLTGQLSWRWSLVTPTRMLLGTIVLWFALKVVFVEVVMPLRSAKRAPREKAGILLALIPEDVILYISRLKDEGIMFYYGRTVLRVAGPDALPVSQRPLYCILVPEELGRWRQNRTVDVVREMSDEQGHPMILVQVQP